MISLSFQLFDVSSKLLLQKVEAMAHVLSEFIGKSTELFARFFGNEQQIGHLVSVSRDATWPGREFPKPLVNRAISVLADFLS